MSYFTHIRHNGSYSFFHNLPQGVSLSQYASDFHITINDATGDNKLTFIFQGQAYISEMIILCRISQSIAYRTNGSIRKLVEDHRVLWLMKEAGLSEVLHVTRTNGDIRIDTLWTPEDAEALLN